MGFAYSEHCLVFSNNVKGKSQDLKHIRANVIYRSNSIYKDCTCPKISSKNTPKRKKVEKASKINNTTKKAVTDTTEINDHFIWSKVYKSPATRRQGTRNDIVKDKSIAPTDFSFLFPEQQDNDNISNITEVPCITTQAKGTSVTSLLRAKRNSKIVKFWTLLNFPRFACPCCTGGGSDAAESECCYRSAAESYETIDLKADSKTALPSLELDPSLMSILRLHRNLKAEKTPKVYAKMIKIVLQNTYKNVVTILQTLRAI